VEACSALRSLPERGTRRDDIRPGLRTVGFRRRVTIVFQLDEMRPAVIIHGIFYGGQDFEAALRDED
jgi:plasmid stabilization system protein ParE